MLVDGERQRQLLDLRLVRLVDGMELALGIHGERHLSLAATAVRENPPEQVVAAHPCLDHPHDLAPVAHRHLELAPEHRAVGRGPSRLARPALLGVRREPLLDALADLPAQGLRIQAPGGCGGGGGLSAEARIA